jgi:hypothetical protein
VSDSIGKSEYAWGSVRDMAGWFALFASGLIVIVSAGGAAASREIATTATQYSGNAAPLVKPAENTTSLPVIRRISLSDLHDALRLGWEDFKAVPTRAFNLRMIYPLVGLALARVVLGYSVLPLLFPLAAGFALLGPYIAGDRQVDLLFPTQEQVTVLSALEPRLPLRSTADH